jgi:thioredoxin 1
MQTGNVVLCALGAVLAGFVWMMHDVNQPHDAPPVGGGGLSAALAGSMPVLVEFYADWCGPCQSVGPQVVELARELRGQAEVVRLNVDENGELAQQYGVHGIPCFIGFKNGKETAREMGAIPPHMMRSMIGL